MIIRPFFSFILDENGDNDITVENTSVVRNEPVQDGTRPPKVDSPMEALHEKVEKQIIKEGYVKQPSKLSTCFCKQFIFSILAILYLFGSTSPLTIKSKNKIYCTSFGDSWIGTINDQIYQSIIVCGNLAVPLCSNYDLDFNKHI